ncbi:phage tail tape measure protein [Xanthobacter autotrophicus]|uniref:phage tail tape measure protein n=1 Tax=Xanthobacter autotrophicus TaxID=280 RepID=UPI00372A9742
MSNLDVSLRLRLINMLRGPAQQAKGDLKGVEVAAKKLNGTGGGDKLARDLNKVSSAAQKANSDVSRLARTSRALGAGGVAGAATGGGGSGLGALAAGRAARVAATTTEVGSALGMSGAALGVTAAGGAAAGGAIAVGLALKSSVQEAIKFENAMAEVQKAVDMSPEAFAALEREILKISRVTPLAKEEIAQLVAQAGFAGRPTEDLVRFGTFAAKAAVAFGMTAEDAGDSLAKMGNVFGLTQDGIERLGDTINTLGDNTASKEREIVEFLKRVGAQAKTFGLAEREAAAFGATMLSLGTSPEVAATGFNALITKLQTASKQGKSFQGGLKALGLTSKQVGEMVKKGPADAIIGVLERVQKLPADKRVGALVDLFGNEYADDAARLAGAIDQIVKNLRMVRDEAKNSGSVERAFKIFDDLTDSKLKKLGHQFEVLGARIGKALTPTIGAAADALAGLLEKINTTLDRNADVKEMADNLTGGGDLAPEQKDRLKKDPALNQQFQGAVAAKDHPVIGLIQQQIELERELAAAREAGSKGDLGAQNKVVAVQAALASINAEIQTAMKAPGAAEAVAQSMRAVATAVSTEGEAAVQAAQAISDRIKALFNFTVSPTIAPTFAPAGGSAPAGDVPLPPKKPKRMSAAGSGSFAQTNTFHITGGDPEATARAVERRLAQLGNSSGALYDTA